MTQAVSITLPPPTAALHAHAKGRWQSKSKPTRELRHAAQFAALQAMGRRRFRWKKATITYRFYFRDNRERDAANAMQSMKPAVDGVVDSGLIFKDSWQYLSIEGIHCGIDRNNPRTELIFRESV